MKTVTRRVGTPLTLEVSVSSSIPPVVGEDIDWSPSSVLQSAQKWFDDDVAGLNISELPLLDSQPITMTLTHKSGTFNMTFLVNTRSESHTHTHEFKVKV